MDGVDDGCNGEQQVELRYLGGKWTELFAGQDMEMREKEVSRG